MGEHNYFFTLNTNHFYASQESPQTRAASAEYFGIGTGITQHVSKISLTGQSLTYFVYFGKMVTTSASYQGDDRPHGRPPFGGSRYPQYLIIRWYYGQRVASPTTKFLSPPGRKKWGTRRR